MTVTVPETLNTPFTDPVSHLNVGAKIAGEIFVPNMDNAEIHKIMGIFFQDSFSGTYAVRLLTEEGLEYGLYSLTDHFWDKNQQFEVRQQWLVHRSFELGTDFSIIHSYVHNNTPTNVVVVKTSEKILVLHLPPVYLMESR